MGSKRKQQAPAKRKAAAPPVAEDAAPAAAADQPAAARRSSKRKAAEPPAAAAAADAKPQRRSKKQQQQQQQQQHKEEEDQPEPEPAAPEEDAEDEALPSADADDSEGDSEGEEGEEEEDDDDEIDEATHEAFMQEISAREEALKKHCVILEQVGSEGGKPTLEQLRALKRVFVPQQVQDDFIEVWSELDAVGATEDEEEGGEDEEGEPDIVAAIMQAMMGGVKMLNTRHSAVMHGIVGEQQKAIDKALKSKSWQPAFCRWVATLLAIRREPHWYEDTDVPEQAKAIYAKARAQWNKLKKRSDEELGGLVSENGGAPLAELQAFLKALAQDMRECGHEVADP